MTPRLPAEAQPSRAGGFMLVRRTYSTLFWVFLVLSSALLFPVALLSWAATAPFDRRKRVLHRFTCWWASQYTVVNPLWPVRVEGRDRIDPDCTYVMVANHLSLLDIHVLFRLSTNHVGLEGGELPGAVRGMEHAPQRLHPPASRRPPQRAGDDGGVRPGTADGHVGHDVPREDAVAHRRTSGVQAGSIRFGPPQ